MDFDAHVDRIDALTRNARNTWFVLLGVLVFITITLMGVEDIDFYGVDRATKLPLVDVEVPTRLFFVAAPILAAAVYGYFHLYLIRLWDALGAAPAEHKGRKLGDAVTPWLVTDMALFLRPEARVARAMDVPAFLLNVGLAWVFGIAVLGWLWWESATGREALMTVVACGALIVSLTAGYASARTMWIILKRNHGTKLHATKDFTFLAAVWVASPLLLVVSHSRSEQASEWVPLASVDLAEARLVERPVGWLQYEHAQREFQVIWCKREEKECAKLNEDNKKTFAKEWLTRRKDQIDGLNRPAINNVSITEYEKGWEEETSKTAEMSRKFSKHMSWSALNMSSADLRQAFLSGMNLNAVRLQDAILEGANLEGAALLGAQLQGANLRWAQLQNAQLSWAQLHNAVFFEAQLQDANLFEAQMQNADFIGAQLSGALLIGAQLQNADLIGAKGQGANLRWAELNNADLRRVNLRDAVLIGAQLQDADLSSAQLQGANLFGAQMQNTILRDAQMQNTELRETLFRNTDLVRAQMQNSVLDFAVLTGVPDRQNVLFATNFSSSTNDGGMLRFVDLSHAQFDEKADWRNVFLDASVTDAGFKRIAARGAPCQWVRALIEDEAEFMALWRWWSGLVAGRNIWQSIAPKGHEGTKVASPALRAKYGIPEDCTWQTGPLKTFPGPHGP